MEKYKEQAIAIFNQISHVLLVIFYWLETKFDKCVRPRLEKMTLKCWAGTVALIALGWLLAKIF